MRPISLLCLPALLAALPAAAQDPANDPRCATVRVAMPAELARWSNRAPLVAGATTRSAPVMVIGQAADVRLGTIDAATLPATPGRAAPDNAPYAGVALFQVARAGTYRVALGAPAWIDVVRAGRALASSAHGHGPMCTGIRKMVDFRLTPGRYVLQISGHDGASIPVMIVRAPRAAA